MDLVDIIFINMFAPHHENDSIKYPLSPHPGFV
jgi:hypothetical protein